MAGTSRDIPVPKTPRQKWIETKESWERSRHIEVPAPIRAAPPASRGFARRLPDLPGQPALWWPGRLHPPPDPRAGRPRATPSRCSRGRPGPSSTPGSASPRCPGSTSTATRTPFGCPHPREFTIARGLGRVRHHVHRRLRGAPGLLPAGPPDAGGAPRRVRRGPRQPVPGQRHARHGRGRVAAADDACTIPSRSTASWRCRTRRTPGSASPPAAGSGSRDAGPRGPRPARRRHGVAELPQGHRGADAGGARSA